MGRQNNQTLSRVRRLAHALAGDPVRADQIVAEVLAGRGREMTEVNGLFALVVAGHRGLPAAPFRRPIHGPTADMSRAFAALPLAAREVLALVTIEQLDYASAAAVLGTTREAMLVQLEEARAGLARLVEGQRTVPLRLVK